MDDNRRRNKKGRLKYELTHLTISTMSVVLAWTIITFVVAKTHPTVSIFDNYKYLFICLIVFIILSYILAQIISDTVAKIKEIISRRGRIKKKNG